MNTQLQWESKSGRWDARTILAFTVTLFSILSVAAIAITMVWGKEEFDKENAQIVLTGVLPLLGTWVGTILAYYFSKDNFEAAASSERMRMEIQQLNPKIMAFIVARKLGRMVVGRLPATSILLTPGKSEFDLKGVRRLPVLDANNHPHFILHKTSVTEFIAKAELTETALAKLTLDTVKSSDPQLLALFASSFATIGKDASITDAKRAMENIPSCQDVFITEDGTRNSPVLAWLTQARILEQLGD
ncbi:MAG: hypothetical protein COA78_19310 [Blastopirellula sp.]|nr:MAG: hypothetical protein COA78_19310 [Blastopirellula sp.]